LTIDPSRGGQDMNPALTSRNILLLFALSLGVSAATRFAGIPLTLLDGDEGIYLLLSREILDGVLPYQGSFDHKPAGLYYLFALAQLLFGQGVHAIRLLAILACGLTAFLLALTLMSAIRSGLFAAANTAVLYVFASLAMGGLATNTEILLNCYFSAALAVFHLARLSERFTPWHSALAGVFLGLMFHTNYLGGPAVAGFGVGYLVSVLAKGGLSNTLSAHLKTLAALSMGFLGASFIILAPIAMWSNLPDYFTMQATYLSIYYRDDDFSFWSIIEMYQPYVLLIAFYAIAVVLSFRDGSRRRSWRNRETLFVVQISIYLMFGLFAILISGRFYSHYSILLLPGLTLAAGTVLARLPRRARVRGPCAAGALALSLLLSLVPQRDIFWHGINVFGPWMSGAPTNVFMTIANDINDRSEPSRTLYVYQFNAVVYYLTKTTPPTRFPVDFHHLGLRYIGAFGTNPVEEMARILETRPHFILVGDADSAWNPKVSRILKRELNSRYKLIERYRQGQQPVHLYERKDLMSLEPKERSTNTP
jgi:4-amino-4-deoxy-L-arabinose transferase-like glycosyltransferase